MTFHITIKPWMMLVIVVVATVLMAQQYTSVYSQHLFNSLIDATDIGLTTPKQGKFTTSTATSYTGPLHGNADTATTAQTAVNAQNVPWAGVSGKPPVTTWNWQWAGQPGQPSWMWGSNDGQLFQVYNPSNFSVNYANSANTANVASSANSVAWANVTGKPYPVTAGQTWNWAPQGGQTYMWGTPDGNNMYPYNPANFSVNYANSANSANYAATAPWSGISNPPPVTTWTWQYSGQNGQPTWLWGTNDGNVQQVWNPAQFHVASADVTAQVTGLQMFQTGATCHTSTASNSECNTTFNLAVAYPAADYLVYCTPGQRGQGQPVIQSVWVANASQFNVTIRNNQANPPAGGSYFNTLTCFAERHLTGS
jgi:hypothetical protein